MLQSVLNQNICSRPGVWHYFRFQTKIIDCILLPKVSIHRIYNYITNKISTIVIWQQQMQLVVIFEYSIHYRFHFFFKPGNWLYKARFPAHFILWSVFEKHMIESCLVPALLHVTCSIQADNCNCLTWSIELFFHSPLQNK